MTHVNPSPSQFPEEKRKPKPRIYLSRCFQDWILFLVGLFINITIVSFDLVTDWFVWKVLSSLWVNDHVVQNGLVDRKYAYLRRLPVAYLAFVIAASVVFVGHVIQLVICFWVKRNRYRSNVDGIVPNVTTAEKCIADLVIMFQLMVQDVPLTVIVFVLQIHIGCNFYYMIYDETAILLSQVSTVCSVVLKFFQTIWNWGCCGRRGSYHDGSAPRLLRIINCVLLCTAFIFVVVNFILISPVQHNQSRNRIAHKVHLDRWHDKKFVIFTIGDHQYHTHDAMNVEQNTTVNVTYGNSSSSYAKPRRVTELNHIFMYGRTSAYIEMTINETEIVQPYTGMPRVDLEDGGQINCTFMFAFNYFPQRNEIQYNIGYRCDTSHVDKCMLKRFDIIILGRDSQNTNDTPWTEIPRHHLHMDTSMENVILDTDNQFSPPSVLRIIKPEVRLSSDKTSPCGLRFTFNSSMLLPNTIC